MVHRADIHCSEGRKDVESNRIDSFVKHILHYVHNNISAIGVNLTYHIKNNGLQ